MDNLSKLEREFWPKRITMQITTVKNQGIYFALFSLEEIDEICCHTSVFLIRPTPTHDYSLQVNLKILIFQFADPT